MEHSVQRATFRAGPEEEFELKRGRGKMPQIDAKRLPRIGVRRPEVAAPSTSALLPTPDSPCDNHTAFRVLDHRLLKRRRG